jgi:Uma2 family endonuclease
MVGVRVTDELAVEPDVVLLRNPYASRHYYAPDQVLLAVEVVSPSTKRRDRFAKPELYAAAGVAHYWRIEQEDGPRVYAYDLVDGGYRLAADAGDGGALELAAPFKILLPIDAITP